MALNFLPNLVVHIVVNAVECNGANRDYAVSIETENTYFHVTNALFIMKYNVGLSGNYFFYFVAN